MTLYATEGYPSLPLYMFLNWLGGTAVPPNVDTGRVSFLTTIHVFVLGGTAVPPNVDTVHTSNTARKTSCGVLFSYSLERAVALWHENKFVLYGRHIANPLVKRKQRCNSSLKFEEELQITWDTPCAKTNKASKILRSRLDTSFPARHLLSSFHSCHHLPVARLNKSTKTS
jgi:hypothetical protein